MIKTIGSKIGSFYNKCVEIVEAVKEHAENQLVESQKGFKQVVDGVDCNVSESRLVAPVNVRWVFRSRQYTERYSGSQNTQRLRTDVVDLGPPVPLHQALRRPNIFDGFSTDSKGREYRKGILYRNSAGDYFAVIGGPEPVATFRSEGELRAWYEDHLEYNVIKKEFA